MKNNETLKNEVLEAIRVEPLLDTAQIKVTANEGIVTLSGTVDTYVKKRAAEHVAGKVSGVHAVVENIKVKFGPDDTKTDEALASEIFKTLKFSPDIIMDSISVLVEDGWVTLAGEVKWSAQKEEAERAIHRLSGVRMISNNICIRSERDDDVEKAAIENALLRNWAIDDEEIEVSVLGNQVTLIGKVHSLYQRNTAERIAWNAPGVCNVHNKLTIEYADSIKVDNI
ncbi:BON domain-containing protein [Pedobacter mendelii]|uniref:Osmotically inducible protein Y n=1 Tax=Pedobacter mendelii TaxID=1908240 RepID=A0ABQ2BK26_9SPHI|nr:BON domain-containing protein [Pedobacter mendelii]GGI26502.1 osmotically inducible protein Y [Pedobacter mendelii]